jgi:hypothetical protein
MKLGLVRSVRSIGLASYMEACDRMIEIFLALEYRKPYQGKIELLFISRHPEIPFLA